MSKKKATKAAEKALRALGKEDFLYAHHGVVHARPEAYERLGEFFTLFAYKKLAKVQKAAIAYLEALRGVNEPGGRHNWAQHLKDCEKKHLKDCEKKLLKVLKSCAE